jgi:hypothetical protein
MPSSCDTKTRVLFKHILYKLFTGSFGRADYVNLFRCLFGPIDFDT